MPTLGRVAITRHTVGRRLSELQLAEYISLPNARIVLPHPLSCGHMALSDHYLLISCAKGALVE